NQLGQGLAVLRTPGEKLIDLLRPSLGFDCLPGIAAMPDYHVLLDVADAHDARGVVAQKQGVRGSVRVSKRLPPPHLAMEAESSARLPAVPAVPHDGAVPQQDQKAAAR